jgi:hypothetical protein
MPGTNGTHQRPLQGSLARLNGETEWLQGELGPPPAGWVRAAVAGTDAGSFARLEEPARRETGGADPRTIGAAIVSRYAYPAGLAALLYVRERRVPRLDPTRVAFATHEGESPTRVALAGGFACLPEDPDADHPDARPVLGEGALRARLALEIVSYLEPAIEPFYERTRLGRKALWGRGAALPLSALAWELFERGEALAGKEEAEAIAAQSPLLARVAPRYEVVESDRGLLLTVTEGACCRSYRWPSPQGKCDSCPLLPADERVRLQRAHWEAQAPAEAG